MSTGESCLATMLLLLVAAFFGLLVFVTLGAEVCVGLLLGLVALFALTGLVGGLPPKGGADA